MFESIPSLDNPREEPEKYERTLTDSSERNPSPDVPPHLLQVEEIADVRGEIMSKLFVDNSPAERWREISKDVLSRHPGLRDYEPFFENIIFEALQRHNALEKLWVDAGGIASDSPHRRINPGLTEANSNSAGRLFGKMFGAQANGKVEATKGKFSLTFVLDEKDVRSAYKKGMESGQFLEETPLGFAMPGGEVPVIVINRNASEKDPNAEIVATTHEAQHIQNSISREGRFRTLQQLGTEDGAVLEKMFNRENEGLPTEEMAKDELLAQFTYLRLLEGSRSANPELGRKFDEVVSEFGRKIKSIADPGEYYFRRFQGMYSATEVEKVRYQQNVVRGVDAYLQLWELFKKSESEVQAQPAENVFFKVSNILEQFPLYKWPAIARLFEMRRRKGKFRSNPKPGIRKE